MYPGTDNPPVLTSWKDIANYMGKGVRTVQRWEQDFGLPVRRPRGSNKKAVLARPRDLDAWVALRCSSRSQIGVATAARGTPVSILSSLAAHIETSRQLRESSRELLNEVHSALAELRNHIASLQVLGH